MLDAITETGLLALKVFPLLTVLFYGYPAAMRIWRWFSGYFFGGLDE